MNRAEFMQQLERLLSEIPESDRMDAIAYYNNYFDEAGPENEAQVIRELESPEKVAETIKKDSVTEEEKNPKKVKRDIPWVWIVVLLVLASPILLGLAGGLLGGVLGLLGGVIGIVAALAASSVGILVAGVVLFIVGIFRLSMNPLDGLVTIGIGSVLLFVGILMLILFSWCAFEWIPKLCRWGVDLVRRIFHKIKGGEKA